MIIYIISGASGSGKTTIIPDLKTILKKDISIYDFDDIGVPKDADTLWRQASTEKWLQRLLSENKDVCLLGQIVLGEILACPCAQKIDKLSFCLLDVSDIERIRRLEQRNTYGADQNMLNWAAWLRMHTHTPKWAQHVIKDNAWNELDFSKWESLSAWPNNVSNKILDTSNLSIQEVAHQVASWVDKDV